MRCGRMSDRQGDLAELLMVLVWATVTLLALR